MTRSPAPSLCWLLAIGGPLGLASCAQPTLATVQEQIFSPRCANAACHGGDNPAVDLDLQEGAAYDNLVNVASQTTNGAIRLVPGDPEASLVFQVTGEAVGPVRQMPPSGDFLDDTERDLLRQWIEDGAPRE